MDDSLFAQLKTELTQDEGRLDLPYDDKTGKTLTVLPTGGKVTIGIGRNLSDRPLSPLIIDMMLHEDIGIVDMAARRIFLTYDQFSQNRKAAVSNLLFNLGETRFLTFKKMIAAIDQGYWNVAARELLSSAWAKQVQTERVNRIVTQLKDG